MRRLAKVLVSGEMLTELLRGRCGLLELGLLLYASREDVPADVRVVRVAWEFAGVAQVALVVESKSFPKVAAGATVEQLPIRQVRWNILFGGDL